MIIKIKIIFLKYKNKHKNIPCTKLKYILLFKKTTILFLFNSFIDDI
jgi:hypothetical protein